ncbi:4-hydroxy-3-methylbut-2-enyl diphosphate reductase [Phenylobacterium sp.]|uniref:4-hydroxy-3-methylbut-2-enyl diphosphate reductase n=1 Tax=Phenylobacterium sp. TaxID=1871053 RepID=UPI0025E29E98|nr:4-hydroxy-3-methylbut-2-enyl diphosphate reductase [Phenylobacterium sp.]MCA6288137.1 4-hydroxy-3-methylbut-2-enyl diphosphate reductase [Phenylobacterium sp.]MCA6344125.1 4-hydroxy-3-methylbut-2-enyl diphosphate reductase [Phenylobacterium sp.]
MSADPAAPAVLTVRLAAPRGFCAGVDRAIQVVEATLERFGAPVYVRHEIVHNRHVVSRLRDMGAVFVETLEECPDDRPVVFSAHGSPRSVMEGAQARGMTFLDATCPLVSKVHVEAARHHAAGRQVLLIGHAGHPEVVGTMGQLPDGAVMLIETLQDAQSFVPQGEGGVAYVTQTTLSVDDTAEIVEALKARFPDMAAPHRDDICYATTNRQEAVKSIAGECDVLLVIGSANSSNSVRLVEVGLRAGAPKAFLIDDADDLDLAWLAGARTVGVTAGASAPEDLVQGVIHKLAGAFAVTVEEVGAARETVSFKLPRALLA